MAELAKAGYLTNAAGVKAKATALTGRFFVNLPHLPSVTILYLVFGSTGSIDIEINDGKSTAYIPIRTITANSLVKLSIPAANVAANITANGSTITAYFRTVVVSNIPNLAIEVFTAGSIEPQEISGTLAVGGTFKKLYQGQPTSSVAALYTVPANTATRISYIIVTNTTGSDRTIEFYHDGTAATNNILPTSTVVAGGFAEFDGEMLLEAGDTLQGKASVSTTLTVTIYGIEKSL